MNKPLGHKPDSPLPPCVSATVTASTGAHMRLSVKYIQRIGGAKSENKSEKGVEVEVGGGKEDGRSSGGGGAVGVGMDGVEKTPGLLG
ncbi:hypothetical protein H5410_039445 [Solanum commersonii]|uniref:Uncharacterized protein n=1 Tax=Solanum commersonii TaxID=4109 RepID=A0A9J5XKY1_SOLCO|nr:hypothetical protein H5410_039445 [Solanum commersonii]